MTNTANNPMPQSGPVVGVPSSPPPDLIPQTQNQQTQETVVIPAGVSPDSSKTSGSQFMPQVVVPTVEGQPNQPGQLNNTNSGSPFGKILIIILLILFLGGLGVGGFFLFNSMSGGKNVTITYWGLWENDAAVKPVIDAFEASNPKIKVEYVKESQRQYRERLQAAIDRGEGPDVFRFHNTWVPMLKNQLDPVPKTIITPEEFGTTFYPAAKNDLVAGTVVYGIPLEIDGLGLYINDDLFTTAGLTPPTTWEDVLNLVPKLTVKSDTTITTSAIALGTTTNIENWSDILATMVMQNGSNLAQPTDKAAEEALIFYRKFTDPSDPVYTWNETMDNSIVAFANGRVAMILAPSWRAFDVKEIAPNLKFHIAAIPQLPGNTVNWASYWVEGVSAKSKHVEQARLFLKYLTSKDAAVKLYTESAKNRLFGEPYARVALSSSVAGDPYVEAYLKEAPTAKSFPLSSRTFDNGLNDKMIKYLEDAVNGLVAGGSPTQVLGTAATGFRQVLGQYGLTTASAPAAK